MSFHGRVHVLLERCPSRQETTLPAPCKVSWKQSCQRHLVSFPDGCSLGKRFDAAAINTNANRSVGGQESGRGLGDPPVPRGGATPNSSLMLSLTFPQHEPSTSDNCLLVPGQILTCTGSHFSVSWLICYVPSSKQQVEVVAGTKNGIWWCHLHFSFQPTSAFLSFYFDARGYSQP